MLKIKFTGFFNANLKKKKKLQGSFNNSLNLIYFSIFLKKTISLIDDSVVYKLKLFRKKTFNIFFIKSNIRYKISKHVLQKLSNRFLIELIFKETKNSNNTLFKKFNLFSSSYMNANNVRISKKIKNNNLFLI